MDKNTFGYARRNPLRYSDPEGLQTVVTDMGAGTTTFDPAPFGTGPELRLVTIRLSKEPLCADAHTVRLKKPLSTKEGIHLNSDEAVVLKHYRQPRYVLRPPPVEVVRDFFGDSSKTKIDLIDQYVSNDDTALATARFYISHGQVVGIEVSVDE